jgi:hypothetical protein
MPTADDYSVVQPKQFAVSLYVEAPLGLGWYSLYPRTICGTADTAKTSPLVIFHLTIV